MALILKPQAGIAVDESRLWLPKNHEKHYLDLLAAARAAESLDRCRVVLRATIDLEKSVPAHPIFRILCRQDNGRTYNELVDGLSNKTLTTVIPEVTSLSEAELEALRIEQERLHALALEEQKTIFRDQCSRVLEDATRGMIDTRRLNENPEPLEFSLEHAHFEFDFDAKSIEGEVLNYRAVCVTGNAEKETELRVRKRRE